MGDRPEISPGISLRDSAGVKRLQELLVICSLNDVSRSRIVKAPSAVRHSRRYVCQAFGPLLGAVDHRPQEFDSHIANPHCRDVSRAYVFPRVSRVFLLSSRIFLSRFSRYFHRTISFKGSNSVKLEIISMQTGILPVPLTIVSSTISFVIYSTILFTILNIFSQHLRSLSRETLARLDLSIIRRLVSREVLSSAVVHAVPRSLLLPVISLPVRSVTRYTSRGVTREREKPDE